jgi:opacity protein-like surface antigen
VPTSFRMAICMLLLTSTGLLRAQASGSRSSALNGDLAVTYITERSIKAGTSDTFWMQGGSAELGFNLIHGIGVAGDYTGTHASSIGNSGVPLTLTVITFGPRYRWHAEKRISIYGEGLIGVASGSNSVFPGVSGATSNANNWAWQAGGGFDFRVTRHLALRALDIGYLHTELPNATNNAQNILRLGAGLALRF